MLAVLVLGCAKEAQKPLKVGLNLRIGYECLYLARDMGFYGDAPIQLKEYPSASAVIRAYGSGDLDAAAITMDELFLLGEQGEHPRIALILDISNGGDAILGRPGLIDLHSLKGLRVGVEATALGIFVLARALEIVGMDLNDVEIVHLKYDEHEKAFKEGEIDAVVTFDPVRIRLLEAGAVVLFDSTEIPGEIIDDLVVRGVVLRENKDTVSALMDGWFHALKYQKKHPDDASRRIAPHWGLTPGQYLSSLQTIHIPDFRENQTLLKGDKRLLVDRMRKIGSVLIDGKLLKNPVNPFSFLDNRLWGD